MEFSGKFIDISKNQELDVCLVGKTFFKDFFPCCESSLENENFTWYETFFFFFLSD